MTIYTGNIPYNLSDDELKDLFERFGKVKGIKIIKDKHSGRSKGFGFIEMENDEAEEAAIRELNRHIIMGRNLVVARAHSEKGYERR